MWVQFPHVVESVHVVDSYSQFEREPETTPLQLSNYSKCYLYSGNFLVCKALTSLVNDIGIHADLTQPTSFTCTCWPWIYIWVEPYSQLYIESGFIKADRRATWCNGKVKSLLEMGGGTDPGTAFCGIQEQNSVPDNHRGAKTTVAYSFLWYINASTINCLQALLCVLRCQTLVCLICNHKTRS